MGSGAAGGRRRVGRQEVPKMNNEIDDTRTHQTLLSEPVNIPASLSYLRAAAWDRVLRDAGLASVRTKLSIDDMQRLIQTILIR